MSLFQCDKCGCMENTALTYCSHSFLKNMIKDPEKIVEYKKELGLSESDTLGDYCSECCPAGKKKWHNRFKRIYLEKGKWKTDRDGNLKNVDTGSTEVFKYGKDTPYD